MNKFLLFYFAGYYPSGGADDLRGTYPTLEEALANVPDKESHGVQGNGNCSHIYSIEDNKIVWEYWGSGPTEHGSVYDGNVKIR